MKGKCINEYCKSGKRYITEEDIKKIIYYNIRIEDNIITDKIIIEYLYLISELNTNIITGIGFNIKNMEKIWTFYDKNMNNLGEFNYFKLINYIKSTEYYNIKKLIY